MSGKATETEGQPNERNRRVGRWSLKEGRVERGRVEDGGVEYGVLLVGVAWR